MSDNENPSINVPTQEQTPPVQESGVADADSNATSQTSDNVVSKDQILAPQAQIPPTQFGDSFKYTQRKNVQT